MTGRAKLGVAGAAAGVALAIALCLGLQAGKDASPAPCPELKGSWFVRYLSDAKPYLDVAVSSTPGAAPLKSVTADLTGPAKTYPDIPLRYNAKDREWQAVCAFLPQPLAGGVWWVSRVRMTTVRGAWREYKADAPHSTYLHRHGDSGGKQQGSGRSEVWIGSFYATEQGSGQPLYTIQTFATQGGAQSNPVLQVYRAADPVAWIAVNDDPDVNQDYARLTMPLKPGARYYIRVDDRYGEGGHYCVQVSRSESPGHGAAAAKNPDSYEGDDSHEQAKPIKLEEVQSRSFSRRHGIWGDEDWLVFTVPPVVQ